MYLLTIITTKGGCHENSLEAQNPPASKKSRILHLGVLQGASYMETLRVPHPAETVNNRPQNTVNEPERLGINHHVTQQQNQVSKYFFFVLSGKFMLVGVFHNIFLFVLSIQVLKY